MTQPNYQKYRNQKADADGIVFHSKRERNRYQDLKILELAGEIRNLELQVRFPLEVNGHRVCTYVGDFKFFDCRKGGLVVEDVKGSRKGAAYAMFRLKSKLMFACHGIEIQEVY